MEKSFFKNLFGRKPKLEGVLDSDMIGDNTQYEPTLQEPPGFQEYLSKKKDQIKNLPERLNGAIDIIKSHYDSEESVAQHISDLGDAFQNVIDTGNNVFESDDFGSASALMDKAVIYIDELIEMYKRIDQKHKDQKEKDDE